jgi:uncharacterized protein YcfJ
MPPVAERRRASARVRCGALLESIVRSGQVREASVARVRGTAMIDKPLVTGLLISAVFVTTGAAVAGLGIAGPGARYAVVLEVAPVTATRRVPREVCDTVKVRGKRTERCRIEYAAERSLVGYDVKYRLGRDLGTVRMDRRPEGARLRFENGVPQLAEVR